MKRVMGYAAVAIASIAGTVAFMVSCSSGDSANGGTGGGGLLSGPPSAHADTGTGCAQWEITRFDEDRACDSIGANTNPPYLGEACAVPAGWEPIGLDGINGVLVRRCKK